VDLKLARIARPGVHLADGKAPPKPPPRGAIDFAGKLGKPSIVGRGRRFRHRPAHQVFEKKSSHALYLEVVARIGAVEGLIAEREVGDDVAFDRDFKQWPLEP
jgi:hypothetical protein